MIRIDENWDLADLVLMGQDQLDDDSKLVLWEIATYVSEDDLSDYSETSDEDRSHLIWMLHLVCHSGLGEFAEYFRGYYGTPDNRLHEMNISEGNTDVELYEFLSRLDWSQIYDVCRFGLDADSIAALFKLKTGCDYQVERERFPIREWDGTPRWTIAEGMYIESN